MSGHQPSWEGTWALGAVVALGGADLLIEGAFGDLSSAETSSFDVGGLSGSGDDGN